MANDDSMKFLPLKYLRVFAICSCFVVYSVPTAAQVTEAKPAGSVISATAPAQAPTALVRSIEPLKSEAEVLAIIRTNKLWERYIPPEVRILRDRLPKGDKESIWAVMVVEYGDKLDDIETNDFQFLEPEPSLSNTNALKTIEEKLWLSAFIRANKEWGSDREVPSKMITRLGVLATPESLRAWALEIIDANSKEVMGEKYKRIPTNQVPAAIRHFLPEQPYHGTLIRSDGPVPYISIGWGSGRGFMGLVIGDTNFQYSTEYAYVISWVSGISSWHSDGRY